MSKITDYNIAKMIPHSLQKDSFVVALCNAVERELKEAYNEARVLFNLSDIDHLPEGILDFLAYDQHIDFYEVTLPIEQKRELLKNSIPWHRKKGTPSAVEGLISTLFDQGRVEEWFEYGGDPYYFRIITTNKTVTNEKATEFIKALDSVKNKRSWLEAVILESAESMNLIVGAFVHEGDYSIARQVY
ncbi:phage tail protein I [Psychrobacillus sp. FSL K6-1267]|uniref:phage tail protein I n=1 Tax=Psychrobacillus sp. FSL K6-1267 TaxID=2921543 RepID=UPI0030F9444A